MPSSTTELIKGKLDIVDFLRGYLTLQPAGKNFKALCPFHHEKSPSFSISPERQRFHCFGCGADGDIFGFVMKYENMEFGEALRMLAEKAGVELKHENPAEYRFTGLLYDLNAQAKDFYKRSLGAAPIVKQYLAERGLTPATIEEFELGWAPNEPEALSMHLLNSGAAPQDLLQAGFVDKDGAGDDARPVSRARHVPDPQPSGQSSRLHRSHPAAVRHVERPEGRTYRDRKICEQPGDADLPKIKIALRVLEEQRFYSRSEGRRARGGADGFFDELPERRAQRDRIVRHGAHRRSLALGASPGGRNRPLF